MKRSWIFILVALAAWAAGRQGARTDINVIPREFIEAVGQNPQVLNVLGPDCWQKMLMVSKAVETEGLTAVSEKLYLPFGTQREIVGRVRESAVVPDDVRLVLLDILTQYYFYTYYYDQHDPRQKAFAAEHRTFLNGLGAQYQWVEPAGENYYLHTFLRQLVRKLPDTKWGKFYRRIEDQTGLSDLPRESEGGEGRELSAIEERRAASFEAELTAGQKFERSFGPGFVFRLEPGPYGWLITVKLEAGDEDISRLTPPFHFTPNPREIEGWHFRNADNSGPNEPGDKNVNAPGEVRDFIFSPEVGRAIDGPASARQPSAEEVEKVRAFGQGKLTILKSRLADLQPGSRARFEWMRFRADLSWPASFKAPGGRQPRRP